MRCLRRRNHEWAEGWADGWAEGEGKGGVRVYETYEVKIKRGKLRCLLLHRKKNFFFYIYHVITWGKKNSAIHYFSHPHTTLLRALWTSARIPRFAAHGLNLTSSTAYSVHSSCGLRAVRLRRLALHFFPHTPALRIYASRLRTYW